MELWAAAIAVFGTLGASALAIWSESRRAEQRWDLDEKSRLGERQRDLCAKLLVTAGDIQRIPSPAGAQVALDIGYTLQMVSPRPVRKASSELVAILCRVAVDGDKRLAEVEEARQKLLGAMRQAHGLVD